MTDTLTAKKIVSTAYSIASNLLDIDWSEDAEGVYILTSGDSSLWVHDLGEEGYLIEGYDNITDPDGGMPTSTTRTGARTGALEDVADEVALFVSFSGADIIAEAVRRNLEDLRFAALMAAGGTAVYTSGPIDLATVDLSGAEGTFVEDL